MRFVFILLAAICGSCILNASAQAQAQGKNAILLVVKENIRGVQQSNVGDKAVSNLLSEQSLRKVLPAGSQLLSAETAAQTVSLADISDYKKLLSKALALGAGRVVLVSTTTGKATQIRATSLWALAVQLDLQVYEVSSGERILNWSKKNWGYGQSDSKAQQKALLKNFEGLRGQLAGLQKSEKVNANSYSLQLSGLEEWSQVAQLLGRLAQNSQILDIAIPQLGGEVWRLEVKSQASLAALGAKLARIQFKRSKMRIQASGNGFLLQFEPILPATETEDD